MDISIASILVVWIGTFASLALFDLYQPGRYERASWRDKWLWAVEEAGKPAARLLLVSLLGLFLEMLVIRWISSEVRIFAYFKNFVLVGCFLGFGLGCCLCRRRITLLPVFASTGLLTVLVAAPYRPLRELISKLPALLGASSEVQIWGVPTLPVDANSLGGLMLAMLVMLPIFALIALMFVPFGQIVGWYLERASNGIRAYSLNVAASLAGILLYTLLAYLDQPPAVWMALAGAMVTALVWNAPRLRLWSAGVFAACVVVLALAGMSGKGTTYWSPYQKLGLTPVTENGELLRYDLNTNDTWYQQIIDLSPRFVAGHPQFFREEGVRWNPYNIPYQFAPHPDSVLVLGAGMGNDVAAALRSDPRRVVAVEIDPLIARLGEQLHFEKPYQSPRVRLVIDDARSYIQNSREKFDLIVFSLLDSHTTSSTYSNIRIDNYVYTTEALQAARRLLRADGLFIVKFQANTPWIAGRLQGLVQHVFPGATLLSVLSGGEYGSPGSFFITGSNQRIAAALADPAVAEWTRVHTNRRVQAASLTTDDWPYFYQRAPGVPACVLAVSACLLALCWLALRKTGVSTGGAGWHFFFLGAGFMLLEAQIISRLALLFGTTWAVNSIVVSALMLLILAANWLVSRMQRISFHLAYAGVFVTIAAAYLIPMDWLFFPSIWLRIAAALTLSCLPVFFAGIIFIQSFAAARFDGAALGSNLLGALVGGLLESLSLWTGIRSLLLIAGLLYVASMLTRRASQPAASDQQTRETAYA